MNFDHQQLSSRASQSIQYWARVGSRQPKHLLDDIQRYGALAAREPRAAAQKTHQWTIKNIATLPVALITLWVFVLRWGEVSLFDKSIARCDWDSWEQWPAHASPHHLIFVADPQLVDPHTYPGRPWPLSSLTVAHTDLYLRRSYSRLQRSLDPNTIMFLGDLFDGGREWATHTTKSPEERYWRYNEDFWLDEYNRFGKIFLRDWTEDRAGDTRIIAGLPGNHDLGFGTRIQTPVRDRFNTYFGESNRVDIIGNHTFVSLDTVSLSAKEEDSDGSAQAIWAPAEDFLKDAKSTIKQIQAHHINHDQVPDISGNVQYVHGVEDTDETESSEFQDKSDLPKIRTSNDLALDFPTVLLTHVPLYRSDGEPCGPLREKHPPTPPPPGQTDPVDPDLPNAIPVSQGYQYQNVLSLDLSKRIIDSLGATVSHVFSGDDHDYCELVHRAYSSPGGGVREITSKSISWAMGVKKPGFVMASLWNEVDEVGRRVRRDSDGNVVKSSAADDEGKRASEATIQTHLCLLPDQLSILIRYLLVFLLSVGLTLGRAVYVVFIRNAPPSRSRTGTLSNEDGVPLLPTYAPQKSKQMNGYSHHSPAEVMSTTQHAPSSNLSARSVNLNGHARSGSPLPSYGYAVGLPPPHEEEYGTRDVSGKKKDDDFDSRGRANTAQGHGMMNQGKRKLSKAELLLREWLSGLWRVARVVLPWFAWLVIYR
ncbi:MAG: hypothetical protein M1831_000961 [Alyxoria varia]|nr:MAG: hypothetical protein M1831_000961 [Alyxoria varia]